MNANNFDPMTFNMILNMMNVMNQNNGVNMNNFNYNMNNYQNLNNLMMNWINNNPNLFLMYKMMMMNQNNNLNQINKMGLYNGQQSDNNQPRVNGGRIPSNIQNTTYDVDPYNNTSLKANITFTTQKGNKLNIVCPYDMEIKDLLVRYVIRVGLGPDILKTDSLFFLFNGSKLDKNDNRCVGDLVQLKFGTNIIVADLKGVIGSKIV